MVKSEKFDHLHLVFHLVHHFTVPLSSDCCHKYDDSTFRVFILPENSCVYICFINHVMVSTNWLQNKDPDVTYIVITDTGILMSGRRHKKLNLLIEFSNSIRLTPIPGGEGGVGGIGKITYPMHLPESLSLLTETLRSPSFKFWNSLWY